MKTYYFKTSTHMKHYNSNKYWIMPDIIGDIEITAENMKTALKEYKTICSEEYGVSISNNAIKSKSAMYRNKKQIGYVITGKTLFSNRSDNINCYQFINLWVEVKAFNYTSVDFGETAQKQIY